MLYTKLYCYEFSADGFVENVKLDRKTCFIQGSGCMITNTTEYFKVSVYRRLCNKFYFNLFIGFGETTEKHDKKCFPTEIFGNPFVVRV